MACLTDRGILMTLGHGAEGCLGHGDFEDCAHPRIVESLLSSEVVQVSIRGKYGNMGTKEQHALVLRE